MAELSTDLKPAVSSQQLTVEIWSDIVCPWCYIGKRRFETALARFAHRDQVDVVWRSFQLDPDAPRRAASTARSTSCSPRSTVAAWPRPPP